MKAPVLSNGQSTAVSLAIDEEEESLDDVLNRYRTSYSSGRDGSNKIRYGNPCKMTIYERVNAGPAAVR